MWPLPVDMVVTVEVVRHLCSCSHCRHLLIIIHGVQQDRTLHVMLSSSMECDMTKINPCQWSATLHWRHRQAAQVAEVAGAAWAGHKDFPPHADSSRLAHVGNLMQCMRLSTHLFVALCFSLWVVSLCMGRGATNLAFAPAGGAGGGGGQRSLGWARGLPNTR